HSALPRALLISDARPRSAGLVGLVVGIGRLALLRARGGAVLTSAALGVVGAGVADACVADRGRLLAARRVRGGARVGVVAPQCGALRGLVGDGGAELSR